MTQSPDGTAARMIEVATSQLGTVEGPNNETKYGKEFGVNGKPWCGSFINWCAKAAHVEIPKVISTIDGAKSFKTKGQWFVAPKVGDLVFFDFHPDDKTIVEHIGLVIKVGETSIVTIEGNTSPLDQSNGGMVQMKTRKIGPHSYVVGYGRPPYLGEK